MEVNFEIKKGTNHIHLPVYLNDKGPFDFALDTGAISTVISKEVIEMIKIEVLELEEKYRERYRSLGVINKARIDKIQAGTSIFENEEVWVQDLTLEHCSSYKLADGLIGHSTLKKFKITVDYHTNLLTFKDSKQDKEKEDNLSYFRYLADTHIVTLPTYINGKGPYDFVLDTGAGGTLLTPKLANELNIAMSGQKVKAAGIGGAVDAVLTKLDKLRVNDKEHSDVNIIIADVSKLTPRGNIIETGILGFNFLRNYKVVIDYPNLKFNLINKP